MPDETQSLILAELRFLRDEFNKYARDTAARVSVMENDLHSLLGNGQPGRIRLIEKAVDELRQWRWWVLGAAAGGGSVVSVIAWMFERTK